VRARTGNRAAPPAGQSPATAGIRAARRHRRL